MESLNRKRLKMSEAESCSTLSKEKVDVDCNFATSNFADIVKKTVFVDKTLLLEAIFHNSSGILITAPRRFGKSTNLDMVKKFVEIQVDETGAAINREESSNYEIFKGHNLLIYQDQKFFNQYFAIFPVIYVNFKPVSGNSYDDILDKIRFVLHKTFQQHSYLLKSEKLTSIMINDYQKYYGENSYKSLDRIDMCTGLTFLSQCLYEHFDKKPVYVLIDECDAPINNTLFEKDVDIDDVNDLLSHMFLDTLKENKYVTRFLVTGLFYFPANRWGGANNIEKYIFPDRHKYVKFYGFTESEVKVLFNKFNIDKEIQKEVESYYGYCIKERYKLFSMSVLHYLERKELQSYRQQSLILSETLHVPEFRYAIESLFQAIPVSIRLFYRINIIDIIKIKDVVLKMKNVTDYCYCNVDLYLSFLLRQGYLSYTENENFILNAEMHTEFMNELITYYSNYSNEVWEECAAVIDEISSTSNNEIYNELIKKFEHVISNIKYNMPRKKERIFHSYLFGVFCKSKFSVANFRLKPDFVITNGNVGIIIEMKYRCDSKTALEEIINEKYYEMFDGEIFRNVTHKIYLGLNVSIDFKVTIAVLINNLDINKALNFPL